MALIKCSFKPKNLGAETDIYVIIPVAFGEELNSTEKEIYEFGGKFQTLFLLHGLTDNYSSWLRRSNIERYAQDKKLAVVMPSVDTSFYTDMAYGHRYWTYVSEELPRFVWSLFPLSDKREDNFVAGLSMGGYGAFKMALGKPEYFCAAASLSGALDMAEIAENAESDFKDIMISNFGSLHKVKGSRNDLFYLAENLKKTNAEIPKLYQACGTEDFLYAANVRFREYAKSIGLDLTYEEGPGGHEWDFWDRYIRRVLDWLPLKEM